MKGTVLIKDLHIKCIIGIYPKERESPQDLFLDLELDLDLGAAEASEEISNTVDYVEVSQLLDSWICAQKFQLIETLAERACPLIFNRWSSVHCCRITVKKPAAISRAAYAAVHIERTRP